MATTVQRKGTSSTPPARKTACIVVRYVQAGAELCDLHERVSRTEIARRLATLKGCEFAGDYDPVEHYAGHLYFVPDETLIDVEARRLGIYSEHDLFGGVVPYPFVGTKTVTHPVVDLNASVPAGWRRDLGDQLRNATLFGFTAFNREDARRACMAVLHECGVARVKESHGIGGRGR